MPPGAGSIPVLSTVKQRNPAAATTTAGRHPSSHQPFDDTMLKTQPKRGSYLMRFARCAGKLVTYTRENGKIRLYNHEGALMDLLPSKFRGMLEDDQIQHLDLPHDLKEDAERLSDEVGQTRTPTEAIDILQSMVQDHPTTLNSNAK